MSGNDKTMGALAEILEGAGFLIAAWSEGEDGGMRLVSLEGDGSRDDDSVEGFCVAFPLDAYLIYS